MAQADEQTSIEQTETAARPSAASPMAAGSAGSERRSPAAAVPSQGLLWDALTQVEDPEIGVDIVNLGLVRELRPEGHDVYVLMTLTSIGCPIGEQLAAEVRQAVGQVAGVETVQVDFTFDPPWTPEAITEQGRDQLLALGYL